MDQPSAIETSRLQVRGFPVNAARRKWEFSGALVSACDIVRSQRSAPRAWSGSRLAVMIVTKRSSNREQCCFGFEIVLLFPSAISHIVAAAVATWQIRK
jgi:hypothetical protein